MWKYCGHNIFQIKLVKKEPKKKKEWIWYKKPNKKKNLHWPIPQPIALQILAKPQISF